MQVIRDAILPARGGMSSSSVGHGVSGIGFALMIGSGWRSMQETCHLIVV